MPEKPVISFVKIKKIVKSKLACDTYLLAFQGFYCLTETVKLSTWQLPKIGTDFI